MSTRHWQIINADVIEGLRQLPDESVHCCVTSPPYFGLRDYGVDGQIGLEQSPDAYVAKLVEVFREVRRVLKDDGTCWINIGDSYAGAGYSNQNNAQGFNATRRENGGKQSHSYGTGLKNKDLIGIPWMLAFALRADGWFLRSDVIWAKPNPMPESVTDRPTKAHEYLFLLTKSARYFYDNEAVKEQAATGFNGSSFTSAYDRETKPGLGQGERVDTGRRNRRSVWTIATQPNPEPHFASFPEELPEICIKAGTSERGCCAQCGAPWVRIIEKGLTAHDGKTESAYEKGTTANRLAMLRQAARERGEEYTNSKKAIGWQPSCKCEAGEPVDCTVLDPFAGTSTTGIVALRLGRRFVGIELNPKYCEISERRLREAERSAVGDLFMLIAQEVNGRLFYE